jgi:subtilisin family serine protease
MSDLKEYIISIVEGKTIDDLESLLTSTTSGLDGVPDRTVDVANPRLLNERQTHFYLADDEAELLRTHPDVLDVSINPHSYLKALNYTQVDNFNRGPGSTANNGGSTLYTNWGLRRVNLGTYEDTTANANYDYHLDGTGVDVVIQDNGVQDGHPEWEDRDGNIRFIQHDWYLAAGVSGVMPTGHYGSVGNHGSHVAGTVAGKHYGWAKNSTIYALRYDLFDLEAWDLIRLWHQNKPVDSRTGIRRPTIVNASWGYRWFYNNSGLGGNQVSRTYRGTTTITNAQSSAQGQITAFGGAHNFTSIADNIATKQMTDAGVIYVKAAGNYYHKTDSSVDKTILNINSTTLQMKHTMGVAVGHVLTAVSGCSITPGTTVTVINDGKTVVISSAITLTSGPVVINFKGPDYDNAYTYSTGWAFGAVAAGSPIYYQRPGSPWSPDTITVGNIDNILNGSNQEQRSTSSEHGPGVDIYAPGSAISSATRNGGSGYGSEAVYPYNTDYRIARISGTSMAAPQVCGLLACYLSINPTATAEDCKEWLANTASVRGQMFGETGLTNDYTNYRSTNGGIARYLKDPWAVPTGVKYKNVTVSGNFDKI